MIVRPTAGALHSQRTRSQSTPPRRRANSTGSTLVKEAQPTATSQAQQLPTSPIRVIPVPLGGSPKHSGAPEDFLLRSFSGTRKLFRLKRPSSSNAEIRAARDRDREGALHVQVVHNNLQQNALGITALISPPASPSVPPRPPRNPARVKVAARPGSSGGPPSRVSRHHTVEVSRDLKVTDDAAADWEFPLPRGSEFPVQRKKSKTSKCHASRVMQDESAKSDVPFSTVDRTILEELRQKIRAREEQFVVRSGRKYHAFPSDEVPYPRSYDRNMVDMDVWDDLWQLQLAGSVTMHVFGTPPARVLDLGCGTGTWILNAAREWKDTHFVGVDVVPLHPDLLQVGCFDLAARIRWVQANFLERLPFPNEEFDYVRVVRVARGVPEDKWDALLEEITRVMRPGGAFEMWEEDLHFPGSRHENVSIIDGPDPTRPPTPPHTDSSHSSEQERALPPLALARSPAFSYSFDDVSRVKRPVFEDARRPLHAIPPSNDHAQTPILLRNLDRPPTNPHDHSLLETIYNEMHSARFINLEPVALLANMLPLHFKDVRAPPPIVITFPLPPVRTVDDERSDTLPMQADKPASTVVDSDSEDHTMVESPVDMAPGTFTFPTVLHGRDMAAGTPFVVLDTNRYSGFSPSALRRSTLPLPGVPTAQAPQLPASPRMAPSSPIVMSKLTSHLIAGGNPLPNKTVNFDPRSLNLLLTLRVNEVLACAEPMWDWVVDFQESVAQAQGGAKTTVGSPRMGEYRTLRASRHRRHAKQDALMSLTRLDFDALMRRFELDMKTRMYLGAACEDRLGWAAYPASSNEDTELFEAMSVAWARYEQRLAASPTVRGRAIPNRNSSPAPPPSSYRRSEADEEDPDATVRGRGDGRHVHHAHSHTHIPTPPLLTDMDGLSRRRSAPSRNSGRPGSSGVAPPLPPLASSRLSDQEEESPPSSRTGRIFVAWKA